MECKLCELAESHEEDIFVANSPHDPKVQLIILKEHLPSPTPEIIVKVLDIIHEQFPTKVMVDDRDSIGHWAARLINWRDQGKSSAKV